MNCKRTMILAMLAAVTVFSPGVSPAEAGTPQEITAEEEAAAYQYENGGMRLLVPKAYDDMLVTEIVKDRQKGLLFRVSEKGSVEAAKKLSCDTEGAGWLFSIGSVDEARRREILCRDMTGVDLFARDGQGKWFVFYHPTDVRYMREDNEAMRRDQEQWRTVTQWASESVRDVFCRANLLESVSYDNSEVGIAIARAAYRQDVRYTVSTTASGPLEGQDFDAGPYAERLLRDALYERTEGEAPEGEYVVLSFPGKGLRYDFFQSEGGENYVRQLRQDGGETLYRVTFADGERKASEIMQAWYDGLAAQ